MMGRDRDSSTDHHDYKLAVNKGISQGHKRAKWFIGSGPAVADLVGVEYQSGNAVSVHLSSRHDTEDLD